jgi:hypothetical protein
VRRPASFIAVSAVGANLNRWRFADEDIADHAPVAFVIAASSAGRMHQLQ